MASYSLIKVLENGSCENVIRDEPRREEGQESFSTNSIGLAFDESRRIAHETGLPVVILKDGELQ